MRIVHPTLLAFFFCSGTANAQIAFGGRPYSFTHTLQQAPVVTMPEVDVAALVAEDEAREASGIKGPWRFGFNHAVDLDLHNSGAWEQLSNGDRLWRLTLECPGALSINLEFHDYVVPEGGRVFIFNDAGDHLGAFTAESNPGHTILGVTQIAGERITIEYHEPAEVAGEGQLRIGQVTHGYRDVLGQFRDLGDSGSCNRNVICPQGDLWRDQIRSVALITVGGSAMCTGQLINNCEEDGTPYFLTARHCIFGSVNSWVFRFNWDSPQCAQNMNGPTGQTVSGATLKVQNSATDVALLELNSVPPAAYDVFYTGWDRSPSPPSSVVGIHHPSGDVKKISHEDQAVTATTQSGGTSGNLNYWKVAAWDDGTTEGGSSGSGLWSNNGLLIGQLWGGQASCSFNFNDYYGRFDLSYTHLAPWLGQCGDQLQGYPLSGTSVVEENKPLEGSIIFPNPTTGELTITLPKGLNGTHMRIFDGTGRMVMEHGFQSDGNLNVDLAHLQDGVHFIQLIGEGYNRTERVVLSR